MTIEPDADDKLPKPKAEADKARGPFVRPLSEPSKGTTAQAEEDPT